MSLTGVTAKLTNADANIRWNVTGSENWEITAIRGIVGRSLVVIDDSHLGLAKGDSMQYCFGDLHELRPITVDSKLNPDDTDVFPDAATTDGSVPVKMILPASNWVLTLPFAATASATTLVFTGAIVDDSGFDLVNNDRPRTTFQIQPDGKTFTWDSNDT
jgi:hypothetical protein